LIKINDLPPPRVKPPEWQWLVRYWADLDPRATGFAPVVKISDKLFALANEVIE